MEFIISPPIKKKPDHIIKKQNSIIINFRIHWLKILPTRLVLEMPLPITMKGMCLKILNMFFQPGMNWIRWQSEAQF